MLRAGLIWFSTWFCMVMAFMSFDVKTNTLGYIVYTIGAVIISITCAYYITEKLFEMFNKITRK